WSTVDTVNLGLLGSGIARGAYTIGTNIMGRFLAASEPATAAVAVDAVKAIATNASAAEASSGASTVSTSVVSAASDSTFVGSSTSQMRTVAARMIAENPNHPLRFLLNPATNRFWSSWGRSHATLIDHPEIVQMGHIISNKSGQAERIML